MKVVKILLFVASLSQGILYAQTLNSWVGGSNLVYPNGNYGTQGISNSTNIPGGRDGGFSWEENDTLWLFGGFGSDGSFNYGLLNDLWKYNKNNGQWTWVSGSSSPNQSGSYGTQGVGSTTNIPGARRYGISWEENDTLWLFGGYGIDASGMTGYLNDLWKYNKNNGQWTWVSGSNSTFQIGSYGTQGVGNTANIPGGRTSGIGWEVNDTLWLFGGFGRDGSGNFGQLNDLWKFNKTNGQWTWVSGSNSVNQSGSYGAQGTGSTSNIPGARAGSISWVENDTLWLFGGSGWDVSWNNGDLNDLWKYNLSNRQWTWVKGSNSVFQNGSYGARGVGSAANIPGARRFSLSWVVNDTLWLFGGEGRDGSGNVGYLNDLWKYNKVNGQWTWLSGSNNIHQIGSYGTQGIGRASNFPGARYGSFSWVANDTLHLLGGYGRDGSGNFGLLNDLWSMCTSCCTSFHITTEPTHDTLCDGSDALFGLLASGDIESYQWQRDISGTWTNLTGETNDSFAISSVSSGMDGYHYRNIISGACGHDTSAVAFLEVLQNPVISGISSSSNPSIIGYAPMQCANLTVSASGGNGSYTYNWSPSGSGNPLNVCPTVGTWCRATVIDSMGCQDTMSFKQGVKNANSPYPGRIYMCHQNNPRRPQYYTLTVTTAQVPYYLELGATFGPCGSTPSKVSGYEIVDLEDIYKIYPNPFNTELNIEFFSLFDEEVQITLSDMNGRELKTLMNERVYEGSMNRISTDASDLPSGIYMIRYVSDSDIRVQKVILNR